MLNCLHVLDLMEVLKLTMKKENLNRNCPNQLRVICLVTEKDRLPHAEQTMHSIMGQKDHHWQIQWMTEDLSVASLTGDLTKTADETSHSKDQRADEGHWILLTDDRQIVKSHALAHLEAAISAHPETDLIYGDEESRDFESSRIKIWRKPDFSPDLLLSCNYFGHFVLVRQSLFETLGGLTTDLEIDPLYDLYLKCVEKTTHILHLPRVLYRADENPLHCEKEEVNAIKKALMRRKILADVVLGKYPGTYLVNYPVIDRPKVSILIPTRDHGDDLEICLKSMIKMTAYDNWEIIIIDNGTTEDQCLALFETYRQKLRADRFKVIKIDRAFNFSELNNRAAEAAKGDFLLLLNNDIEIITEGWLEKMLGYAQQKHIGAVGATLYYADETIQHAGIVMGIGGMAGHSHKGFDRSVGGHFGRPVTVSNYAAVTAAMLMVSKEKYFEVGGLNQKDLKIAFNDVDFCLKLIQQGYFNVVLPQVEAYHYESKSRGRAKTFEQQQREHQEADYIRKHWQKYLDNDPFYNPHLTRRKEDYSEMIFPENTVFFDWYRSFKQKLSDRKYLKS